MSLLAGTNDNIPSTGWVTQTDTLVSVNIADIRKANIKMIERDFYYNISVQQDSVINLKNKLIDSQFDIIDDLENKIDNVYKLKERAEDNIAKANRRNKIVSYCGGSVIVGLIIGILVK